MKSSLVRTIIEKLGVLQPVDFTVSDLRSVEQENPQKLAECVVDLLRWSNVTSIAQSHVENLNVDLPFFFIRETNY